MYNHFRNIEELYGEAYVQIPNGIFHDLSGSSKNIQQISFSYVYLITIAFLYKYAHFVDIDNGTYIQNSDIKQILGYNRNTKTVDKIIKKNGTLESLGLIKTVKDYPVEVEYTDEEINGIRMREFITINMIDTNATNYNIIKSIVKNRNYEIKEPTFMFEYKDEIGTLYNYDKTHRITLKEFMKFVYGDEGFDNTDFLMYAYFKYKCYGLKNDMNQIALYKIVCELGIGRDSFYIHANNLKGAGLLRVGHKGWRASKKEYDQEIEANEYFFKKIT